MKKVNRVGEKYLTTEGYTIEIIEYFGALNCTLQFEDGVIIKNKTYQNIVRGEIKNSLNKSVYGVGYIGDKIYKVSKKGKATKIYKTWSRMLERCYDKKYQEKRPSYIGCSVAEEWHNFQVFAEWFENNYKESYVLDKDILIKGNKIYSSETCCFVPPQINTLFVKCNSKRGECPIGVSKSKNRFKAELKINRKIVYLGLFDTPKEAFQAYRVAKELQIKNVADKWKDKIDPRVYQAMYNYQVEITD